MIQENNIVICKNFPTFIEPRDACRKQHLHRYWRVSSFLFVVMEGFRYSMNWTHICTAQAVWANK